MRQDFSKIKIKDNAVKKSKIDTAGQNIWNTAEQNRC